MAILAKALMNFGSELLNGRAIAWEASAERSAKRSCPMVERLGQVLKAVGQALMTTCRGGVAVRLPGIGRMGQSLARLGWGRARIVPDGDVARAQGIGAVPSGENSSGATIGLGHAVFQLLLGAEHPEVTRDRPLRWAG